MSGTSDRWMRLWSLISRRRLHREVEEELSGHIEMLARRYVDEGMDPAEARRRARARFGDYEGIKRSARRLKDANRRNLRRHIFLDDLRQDARFSLRTLLRSPLFTAAAVLSLAIGIGANASVFTFLHGYLLKPLPFPESDRLVSILSTAPELGIQRWHVTWNEFLHFSENSRTLADLSATELTDLTITGGEEPQRLMALKVTHNYFEVLAVEPLIGRAFLPSDSEPGAPGVAVIGEGLWRGNFGGDEDILGRTYYMNAEPHTIVGVMPSHVAGFQQFWIPIRTDRVNEMILGRIRFLGRLKPGVSIEDARTELDGLRANLAEVNPDESGNKQIVVLSYRRGLIHEEGTTVLIFYVIVSLVLLLACANVANLLIARGTSRREEIAIRASLGAARMRIVRQLLIESLLLAVMGGAIGLLLGRWGRDILLAGVPQIFTEIFSFDISLPVVAVLTGITVFCGLIAGLAPAVISTRSDLAPVLRGGSDLSVGRIRQSRFQSLLVGLEVGIAVLVLVSAGLIIKGFLRIQAMDLGFNPSDIVHMEISLESVGYEEPASRVLFYADLIERIEQHPAVTSVSASNPLPYIGWYTPYEIEGAEASQSALTRSAIDACITPGHFRTMEIPMLQGRDFDERDVGRESVPTVIVSETFARLNWPDEDPIGKRMRYVSSIGREYPWMEVIGVVKDTQAGTFRPATGWLYIPQGQWAASELILAIRTAADPGTIIDHVKELVWSIEPDLALQWNGLLEETIRERYPEPSLYSLIFGIFSVLAVIMACVGVYGVVAYAVVRRSREYGIRLSIGARPVDVVRLVLRQNGVVVLLGMIGGFLAALGLLRLASSIFFGVSPYDPAIYAFCAVLMTAVTLLAMWQPAWRASKLDPVKVLRVE